VSPLHQQVGHPEEGHAHSPQETHLLPEINKCSHKVLLANFSTTFLLLLRVVVVISQAYPSPPSTGLLGGLLLQWYQLFWGWAELAAKAGSVGWRFIEGELKGIKTLETKSFTRTAIFSNSTALSAILILYLK
jgi:hypothetical protein